MEAQQERVQEGNAPKQAQEVLSNDLSSNTSQPLRIYGLSVPDFRPDPTLQKLMVKNAVALLRNQYFFTSLVKVQFLQVRHTSRRLILANDWQSTRFTVGSNRLVNAVVLNRGEDS